MKRTIRWLPAFALFVFSSSPQDLDRAERLEACTAFAFSSQGSLLVGKNLDWAVEGATVTVTRDVFRGGQKLWQDIFKTKYQPWAAVCQYGPGTKNYPPENPDEDDPCKKK